MVKVDKAVLAEIAAAPANWKALRNKVSVGLFLDYRRLILGPG